MKTEHLVVGVGAGLDTNYSALWGSLEHWSHGYDSGLCGIYLSSFFFIYFYTWHDNRFT